MMLGSWCLFCAFVSCSWAQTRTREAVAALWYTVALVCAWFGVLAAALTLLGCTPARLEPTDASVPSDALLLSDAPPSLDSSALPDAPVADAPADLHVRLGPDDFGTTQDVVLSRLPRFRETEVTVADFRAFWAAGHPGTSAEPGLGTPPDPDMPALVRGCTWTRAPSTLDGYPLTCVYRETAIAFCSWEGGRLPTEAEWEATAQPLASAMERAPVADALLPVRWNTAIGGLYDLEANVMELVLDDYANYGDPCWSTRDPVCRGESGPVARGASYLTGPEPVRTRHRVGSGPDLGFRCVYP